MNEIKLRIPVSEDDHFQGSNDAPLVLVSYGDYQCPFCAHSHLVVKYLQKALKDELKFVFRNFPLSEIHPYAFSAARAAEAAAFQGRFWEMHDKLFENQTNLASPLTYASLLNLDLLKFTEDIESELTSERVSSDFYGGIRSGVNGTPTFFINGYRYDGDWSYHPLLRYLKDVREQGREEINSTLRPRPSKERSSSPELYS